MSQFQSIGLSMAVFKPTIIPATPYYDPRGTLITDDISAAVSKYEHEIAADGGFLSASFTLDGEQITIEDWIANGLGRHIEVYDESHNIVWEGFVDSYRATVGSISAQGGPLLDVANQVVVVYTPIDPTADPPATGPETETPAAVDDDSQEVYGILETVYSAGQTQDAGATQIRDTLLEDMKYPPRSESITPGGGGNPSITIECKGYYYWLDKYIFNSSSTSTTAISTKIQAALAADPNKLFSTDYSNIMTNAFLVPAKERENPTAMTVIKELVAIGDANDTRAFFGIYEGRKAYYDIMPSTVKYEHRLADASQRVDLFGGGALVRPWQIRPCDWVFLPDYLTARTSPPVNLRSDPRNIFIESVKYSMPYSVTLNGNRYGRLPQLLAKRGMIGGL